MHADTAPGSSPSFLPPHNSPLPFPAYNGPKVLLSLDTASIHVYSSLTSAKRSPSYTLLVKDTYGWAGTWPLPQGSQQAHTPYLLTAVKGERKRDGDVQALSSLSRTQRTRTQNATKATGSISPWERGEHRRSTVPTTTATVVLVLRLALFGSSPINRPSDVQRS